MKLYALHDKKAKALSSFHAEKSDAVASRGFAEAVLQPKSVFGKYADDFELVCLAKLEESSELHSLVNLLDDEYVVVLTARQVLDSQPRSAADGQLELIEEA